MFDPVILLDIDGTCSPMCAADLLPPQWAPWERGQFGWNKGWTSTSLATALHSLTQAAEVQWCTGWEADAARYGAALDIDVSWVPLGVGGGDSMWKLSAVDAALRGRPVWWIDDEHNASSTQWAAERTAAGIPTTVVACDPNVGVTSDDIAAALCWAEQVRGR